MTIAIDSNVLVALWDAQSTVNLAVQSALKSVREQGSLIIAAPVFAELIAGPGRDEAFVDSFCRDTGITVDWNLDESTWRAAGRAFQAYATRRRRQRHSQPRRILADFLIGAHALQNGYRLLTLDDGLYRTAFPALRIVPV